MLCSITKWLAAAIMLPQMALAQDAPSDFTITANEDLAATLSLSDIIDAGESVRGRIGQIPDGIIMDANGRAIWDARQYAFLDNPVAPKSVNPSLWRQARMNREHGLFEVVKGGVYQVRGYDISGMTLVKGKTGWIIIDPLTTEEAAKAAFALAEKYLGKINIRAFIFTHSHSDHFGGVGGIVTREQVIKQKIRIIAPHGFEKEATSENVLAGNAMGRRASYMFGGELIAGERGQVDTGLGPRIAGGTIGYMAPTETVGPEGGIRKIDGMDFDFLDAAGTEAPAEFLFYIPAYKALQTGEVMTKTMHNVLTLRGAQVRDALHWAKVIDAAIIRWGDKAEVQLASHNWPSWGQKRIKSYMLRQRSAYRYVHDRTLNRANNGATLHELAEGIADPTGSEFAARGYYGTINHNMKATYQRYFGWWDGNPANFNPVPPEESAKNYVALMGGADKVLSAGRDALAKGDYRWAAELLNKLVFADPKNQDARNALASAYDQIGYQAESGAWRNYYLGAASTLRGSEKGTKPVAAVGPAFIGSIPTAAFFDALATRFDAVKGAKIDAVFQFALPDTKELVEVQVNNAVEFPRYGSRAAAPTATVTIDRSTLNQMMAGTADVAALFQSGKIKIEGDRSAFLGWFALHPKFNPKFNVVEP
jgi:alkyl sulfatase BDS1-like metallo-beta-lactamase superfamily hydrolase